MNERTNVSSCGDSHYVVVQEKRRGRRRLLGLRFNISFRSLL